MKICWWTMGPNTHQATLLAALRGMGVDVEVCYFHGKYGEYRRRMGWRDPELHSWEHYVFTIKEARRILPDFAERIQMVPSFFNWTSWKLIAWCIVHRTPWFSVTEGTRGRWMTRPLFRTFCWLANRFALRVFAEGGRKVVEQFVSGGVSPEKVVPFCYATMSPPATLHTPHDGTTFVFAGEFCERKAVDVIAAAWRRLVADFPDARLLVAGDGDLRDVFDGLSGVEKSGAVRQERIYEVICRGDVMLLPSRYDPWGVALVEGAMAGLAMVGSDRTGAADELVEDGVNGFVVKAGDEDDLLRVLRIYAADPALARRHGEKARIAAQRTTGESLARKLVVGLAKGRVAASFWEEHCTECGEPECYRTCAKYVKGRGGRCRRFEGGLQESILCANTEVKFLPWGKMEAYFHGKMIDRSRAAAMERLMTRAAWLRKVFPKWWRSWRWRWTLRGSQRGCPTLWRCVATAERDERLVFAVVTSCGEDVVSTVLELKAGVRKEVELQLPPTRDGTLFRIFTQDGEGTGRIRFECNELTDSAREDTSSTVVKCVAWDLDGTLWQGTLSEDDEEGLTLNVKAVDIVKELDRRGIVNSISSRNDPAEALAALKKFGIEEYFVFPQIGWGPKSEGLRNLAKEMNIGLDAIAFIDDREEMRGEVRTNAPEVRVFAAEEMEGLLARPEFNPPVSAESVSRRASYRAEMVRRGAAMAFGGDYAAFLAASGLQFELLPVEGDAVTRCRELVQRTNQLNLTARRYDEAGFAALLRDAVCKAVRVWDRYGNYGIVGFVAMKGSHIVELCFSCRVAEKGVEKRVLEKIAAGRKLTADIVETARNGKIREIVREVLGIGD